MHVYWLEKANCLSSWQLMYKHSQINYNIECNYNKSYKMSYIHCSIWYVVPLSRVWTSLWLNIWLLYSVYQVMKLYSKGRHRYSGYRPNRINCGYLKIWCSWRNIFLRINEQSRSLHISTLDCSTLYTKIPHDN